MWYSEWHETCKQPSSENEIASIVTNFSQVDIESTNGQGNKQKMKRNLSSLSQTEPDKKKKVELDDNDDYDELLLKYF